MSTLSTHVLDTARGMPASGVAVTLHRVTESGDAQPARGAAHASSANGARAPLATGVTDADGRIAAPFGGELTPGLYELRFDAGAYFARTKTATFYGEIAVRFLIGERRHYHVPLLLSPWSYATYRGS